MRGASQRGWQNQARLGLRVFSVVAGCFVMRTRKERTFLVKQAGAESGLLHACCQVMSTSTLSLVHDDNGPLFSPSFDCASFCGKCS